MTTQDQGAPAQQARPKRLRIDESANAVIEIDKSAAVAPKYTPSEAALAEVKAAVALRPDATQEVVLDVLKEHIKLKTKLQEIKNSKERMNDDAFIPRSARYDFKLTSSPEIMETEEFKTLDADMKADTEAFSKKCKEKIMAVQALVLKGTEESLRKHFYLGLKKFAIMLMSEHMTYSETNPCPYAKFVCWMADEEDRIAEDTYLANASTQLLCAQEFAAAVDEFTVGEQMNLSNEETTLYLTIRDEMMKIVKAVFLSAWKTIENKKTELATNQRLKRTAMEMLEKEKTEAAAMEIDAEPSADPKVLRDLITEGIKKATENLQKEVNKLQQTVHRSTSAKNSNRGASSSNKSASSPKKKGKGPGKGEKKENNNVKNKNKDNSRDKKPKPIPQPPTPRKKQGNSPGRKEKDSPKDKKSNKKSPGGQRQQQKKDSKKPNKPRSS
jgi:hypothetical protein